MYRRTLVRKASRIRTFLAQCILTGSYILAVQWLLNLAFDHNFEYGYVYISALVLALLSLLFYMFFRKLLYINYELNDLGIKSGQLKNKEYGNIVPWSCIASIELKWVKRQYVIKVILKKPLRMRFAFGYAIENEFTLDVTTQMHSPEFLYNELMFFKQQVESKFS
ncbi:hypothetical protein C1O24_21080 [Vibrio diazotrophicus]|nr:hypothetical protein C1O24_21080 [Vibrio diazotrophicus]